MELKKFFSTKPGEIQDKAMSEATNVLGRGGFVVYISKTRLGSEQFKLLFKSKSPADFDKMFFECPKSFNKNFRTQKFLGMGSGEPILFDLIIVNDFKSFSQRQKSLLDGFKTPLSEGGTMLFVQRVPKRRVR